MTIYVTHSIGCGDLQAIQRTSCYCPKSCWDSGNCLWTLFCCVTSYGGLWSATLGRVWYAILICYHPLIHTYISTYVSEPFCVVDILEVEGVLNGRLVG